MHVLHHLLDDVVDFDMVGVEVESQLFKTRLEPLGILWLHSPVVLHDVLGGRSASLVRFS